ncbi:MAG: glycosyltransferase family 39 protein [Anaerolineae bacterium]|nr:glycosyltransferase family 39 protein [Anaerolineae bacterium]
MNRARLYWPVTLALLCGLAFALRIYRLDTVPLRGDEAFAVRYWADSPPEVVSDLAHWEPHPFGAFFGFWAWKHAAGDSEFAMRYLPLLGNLVGVAAVAALSRWLFYDRRIACLAAALWAVNPFLIWHAQDVRNYALWAGISPLAMWLFLRATNRNRPRDWALYVLAEAAAAYTFFLEGFIVVVQVLYLLAVRRVPDVRRRALIAWGVLGVLLIPWLVQIWWLAHSGYSGTLSGADPAQLLTRFLPILLTGDELDAPWHIIAPLAWCGLVALGLLIGQAREQKFTRRWLIAWMVVPAALLLVAATRMNVFGPRYLIAVLPALFLLMARALAPALTLRAGAPRALALIPLALLITPLLGAGTLIDYYRGENAKSPDWRALKTYLEGRARPGDLIVQTLADPAFDYYYQGSAAEGSLTYGGDAAAELSPEVQRYQTLWLIGRSPDAEAFLDDHMQRVSFDGFSSFTIAQYRRWQPTPDEIGVQTQVTIGQIARLRGCTIQGPDAATRAITILLYWEPLAQADVDYTVFAHLIGAPHPATGSPLWDQDDHRPLYGFASTLEWQPGSLIRDPYHLLTSPDIPLDPGDYTIQVGLYDPATGARLPVTTSGGTDLGDSLTLTTIHWPLDE